MTVYSTILMLLLIMNIYRPGLSPAPARALSAESGAAAAAAAVPTFDATETSSSAPFTSSVFAQLHAIEEMKESEMSAAAAPEQSTANDASASTMPSIALLATKQAAKIEAEQAATAVAPRLSPPRASSSSDNALALDRLARAASSAQQHASSPTAFLANTKRAAPGEFLFQSII